LEASKSDVQQENGLLREAVVGVWSWGRCEICNRESRCGEKLGAMEVLAKEHPNKKLIVLIK